MKKRKTYEISVIDKTYSKIISDETKFYTSDTALELAFELKETEYNFESAEIVLFNVDDRSLATRTVSKINNDFVYEIDDDITTHYGDWRGQLMLVENGEVHVSSPIKFRIENDLYCNKPLEITEVVSWVSLKRYADSLVDELKQAVLDVEGMDNTFKANELERQTTFETKESERDETFNANEGIRQTQELEREEAEATRQQAEGQRKLTFEANESERQSAEQQRVEAEKQRNETVKNIEARQNSVETQFNSIQQEMTDKDVISAPEIIAARNGEADLKTRLDKEQQEVDAQLAQKVTKGDIGISDLNKNKTKFDGTWFDDDFLQDLTNGEINTTYLENDSVTTSKIADNAVTAVEIDGATIEKIPTVNVFDKEKIETGGYYGRLDGKWVESYNMSSSDYIPVNLNTEYKHNGLTTRITHLTYWDENLNFLGGLLLNSTEFRVTDANVKFIKVNLLNSEVDTYMLTEKEQFPMTYVPHTVDRYSFGDKWLIGPSIEEGTQKINGVSEQKIKTVNLFDKNSVETGGYYGRLDGKWVSSTSVISSNYIPIELGDTYKFNPSTTRITHLTYWDKDFNFLGGLLLSGTEFRVTDANVKFIKVSLLMSELDSYMLAKKYQFPDSYVPYNPIKTQFDNTKWDVANSNDLFEIKEKVYETNLRLENKLHSNYTEPIRMDLKDFSGYNEPYHPSVVHIEGGFAGYEYWMVQTPFPVGAKPYVDRWEVPVVYKSHDGIEWITVADPLDDLTEAEIANEDYMSDPHILYREDTQTLEVWYRLTTRDTTKTPVALPTKVMRKTTQDGETWSAREDLTPYRLMTDRDFMRSPSVIHDSDTGKYKMWYSNSSGQGPLYNESTDGKIWSEGTKLNLDVGNGGWHMDVAYYRGQYHYLSYNYRVSAGVDSLTYYVSDDGINFKYKRTIMKTTDGNHLYGIGLYRSISMLDGNGKVRIYFSGTNSYNKREIGLMIGDSIEEMNGVKKLDGSMIVMNDGRSLEDLAVEISILRNL